MKTRITKGAICVLMVLLAANVFGTVSSQGQSVLSSEDNIINILGIDPTAYPKIKVNIFVDESCAATGGIVKDDFTVEEDGTGVSIDSLYFTGRASGQKLDLAVVFDETDTMADEIKAMKSNVDDLTNKIKASNIDARYSLVTFKTEVLTKIEWTDDPEVFKREVNQLRAYGGFYQRPEDSLGAVAKALSFGFRPDAQKIVIVITDEPSMQRGDGWSNSTYHQDDVQQELLDAGVMLVAVSPDFRSRSIPSNIPRSDLPLYADMRDLAQNSGGLWINIYSADFSLILDQLEDIITGTYVIEYSSPTTTTSGSRTVSVSVNAPDCVEGDASSTYMAPASPTVNNRPPIIFSLDSDKASPQESGSVITWTVETGDPDGDQVLYKFFLNDEPMTNWTTENTWTWEAKDSGSYRIEAHVRDGKHAGPNGLDDRRSANFEISRPNSPPTITTFMADKTGPQEAGSVITWAVDAQDIDGDPLLYRFLLDDEPTTDWRNENFWIWEASEAGSYRIEAQVRDGRHAGSTGMDDRKLVNYEIIKSDELLREEFSYVEFNRTFGAAGDDRAYHVQPTPDGGYILAGETASYGAGGSDAWLIKTDADGKEVWNRTFGGAKDDAIWQVLPTPDGGYILLGGSESFGAGNRDGWLIKTDSEGNEVWNRTYGGPADDVFNSVQSSSNGGYIIAGFTSSFSAIDYVEIFGSPGGFNAWIIRTDPSGNTLWDKTFGGFDNDNANFAHQTWDGSYILGGQTYNYGNANTFSSDAWLIKTNSRGDKLWDKTYGGTAQDYFSSFHPSSDGDYLILLGATASYGAGKLDIWLKKIDLNGQEVWTRTYGGPDQDVGYMVRSTSDGGYVIAASTSQIDRMMQVVADSTGNAIISEPSEAYIYGNQDVLLIKTDSEGREVWRRVFGGNKRDELSSIEPTTDGGYILAGVTNSFGAGGLDAWLIKVDSEGYIARLPSEAGMDDRKLVSYEIIMSDEPLREENSYVEFNYPFAVTDSAGRSVTIEVPVEKIIVMNSDAADAVSILGDAEKIAGSVDLIYKAHYFAEFSAGWENVGTWKGFNYEKIAQLARDDGGEIAPGMLVICFANKAVEMEESLAAFEKIDVLGLDLYNPETLEEEMVVLGKVLDRESEAEAYNVWVREKKTAVEEAISGLDRPKVYVEGGSASDLGALWTYGPGSSVDDMISLCGGENVINADESNPKVEWETVLAAMPEVMIKVPAAINRLGWSETSDMEAFVQEMRSRPGASSIPAVEDERVYVIFRDITLGTGAVVGLTYLAKMIHPEADLDPVGVYREYLGMRGLSFPEERFFVLPEI